MKICILYNFRDQPWGGGNQFLKSLRKYFEQAGVYEDDPEKAEAILFNSHHCLDEVVNIKRKYPGKILIHRIDGPVLLVRGNDKKTDRVVFKANNQLADGTVFQSSWCKTKCYEHGMAGTRYEEIILNAPDPEMFYAIKKKPIEDRKIRLIATSWSSNIKKGFDIYKYLDEHLDFNKYEMTFVGNSPIKFKNIHYIEPLQSTQLADKLRQHDIFITASLDDPCSNSLIETLHCGLPAIVRNSGGHPEIIDESGIVFEGIKDVCKSIDTVANNYTKYIENINPSRMKEIGYKYYQFIERLYNDIHNKSYTTKNLSLISFIKIILYLKSIRCISSLKSRFKSI